MILILFTCLPLAFGRNESADLKYVTPKRIAVVFHGEYLRNTSTEQLGAFCSNFFQENVTQSILSKVIHPLKESGHLAGVYFHTHAACDALDKELVRVLQPKRHVFDTSEFARTRPASFAMAMSLMMEDTANIDAFILLSFDLIFFKTIFDLRIAWNTLNFPWLEWGSDDWGHKFPPVSDLFIAGPIKYAHRLFAGLRQGSDSCHDVLSRMRWPVAGSGHGGNKPAINFIETPWNSTRWSPIKHSSKLSDRHFHHFLTISRTCVKDLMFGCTFPDTSIAGLAPKVKQALKEKRVADSKLRKSTLALLSKMPETAERERMKKRRKR